MCANNWTPSGAGSVRAYRGHLPVHQGQRCVDAYPGCVGAVRPLCGCRRWMVISEHRGYERGFVACIW